MQPAAWKPRLFAAVTRFGGTTAGRHVAAMTDSMLRAFENDSANHLTNGEQWLVSRLQTSRPALVIDVGANVGTWSALALDSFEDAQVHAFEPLPDTFTELQSALGHRPRFVPHNAALTGPGQHSLTVWSAGHSTLTSAVRRPNVELVEVEVAAYPGDEFCEQSGIDHVDLLKIDVEGHDLAVLQGFQNMIADQQVDVIQFEFTMFAVHAKVWLSDFYDLLEPRGYAIGKLFPTWIAWKDYEPSDERFYRCNFVATVRGSHLHRSLGG